MIRFKKLTVEGIRSFKEEQTLRFPRRPGFFFLSGRNLLHPRLGGNAAGKSSLWDAFLWTLYGQTARGLKAGDVGNWEGNHLTTGTLVIRKGGEDNTVRRTWKPNSLTLQVGSNEPETVQQDRIDTLIGLNFESFIGTVFLGQFNRFFFDLKPAEKLQVFSEALQLNYWVERAERTSRKVKEQAGRVHDLERLEATTQARIETLEQHRAQVKQDRRKKARELEDNVSTIRAYLMSTKSDLEHLHRQYEKGRKRRVNTEQEHELTERKAIRADDKCRGLERSIELLQRDHKANVRELQRTRELLEAFDTNRDICPTCKQPIRGNTKHLKREREKIKQRKEEIETANFVYETEEIEQREELKRWEGIRMKRADRIKRLREELQQHRQEEKRLRGELTHLEQDREKRRETLKRLREEEGSSSLTTILKRVEQDLATSTAQLKRLKGELDTANARLRSLQEWTRLFKELRLWLIEEAVSQLEIEVGNSLQQLGLEGWEVKCRVEKESAKGNVTRGFDVLVRSPDSGGKLVKWEAWCGGETQRLRIAGALGLQRLLLDRLGLRIPLEVWDEPTAHLSEQGIEDLLRFFEGRSREEGRQVWLVDHRSLKAGNFDGEFRVERDEDGSKIVKV